MMRVLIISPSQHGIDATNETSWASQKNDVKLLSGIVTKREVESVLSTEQFDIVHFAQHGSRKALEMSDGMMVADRVVRSLEHQEHLRVVLLNSCDSAIVGSMIHNAIGCPVIAHTYSVSDRAASAFAEEFYNALGNGRSVSDAFREAKAALSVYSPADHDSPILINGMSHLPESTLDGIADAIGDLNMKIDALSKRVDELTANIHGRGHHPQVNSVLLSLILAVMLVSLYLEVYGGYHVL